MMNRSPKQLALIALVIMLATFFITLSLGYGFAVAVMMLIASSGVLTVVVVMMIGSTHGESPVAASDSNAAAVWVERAAKHAQSKASAETTTDEAETTSSE